MRYGRSAVVGSMMVLTRDTDVTGNPPGPCFTGDQGQFAMPRARPCQCPVRLDQDVVAFLQRPSFTVHSVNA